MRKLLLFVGLAILLFVAIGSFAKDGGDNADLQSATKQAAQKSPFNKKQHSLTDPKSIWVVVNKQRQLSPKDYVPSNLVDPGVPTRTGAEQIQREVAVHLKQLFAAATANKTPLRVSSAFRSYSYQVGLYNTYKSSEGQDAADAESARPGYSEHQTGLAVDLGPMDGTCNVKACFAGTPTGKWLAAVAYKYGFIVRYADGKTAITGYEYEPWHLRYVGVPLATEMHKQGVLTMEEFFGLPAAPSY
jgi:zinc D-Ala-D-Ala carboxypeptidase